MNSSNTAKYRRALARECRARARGFERPGAEVVRLDAHQSAAMEELAAVLERGDERMAVVHSGGSGKTVLAAAIVQASRAAKLRMGGRTHSHSKDLILVVERSLAQGVRDHVASALDTEIGVWGMSRSECAPNVLVVSIQTLTRHRNQIRKFISPSQVSLIIGDEADRFLTRLRKGLLDLFPNAVRIGLTATPEWPDGRHIIEAWGKTVHQMSLKAGIENGINVSPSYYIFQADVDGDAIEVVRGDYSRSALTAALRSIELETAVPKVYETLVPPHQTKLFPTLVYLPSLASVHAVADRFVASLGRKRKLEVRRWTGEISNTTLTRDIEDFQRGAVDVLLLCEMGGRGLNLPRARCVIDAYPTLSANKLEQRHSRALRRIRPGTSLHREGFEKNYALIAQLVPRSIRRQPISLLDILDCWSDYRPGRILGIEQRPGAGIGSPGHPAPVEEIEAITQRLRESPWLGSRLSLLEQVDVAQQMQLRKENHAIPVLDGEGFTSIDNVKYGTVESIHRVLGLSVNAIRPRVLRERLPALRARTRIGKMHTIYRVSDVRQACSDLLDESLPHADAQGWVDVKGVKHGHVLAIARHLDLYPRTVRERIRDSDIDPLRTKAKGGQTRLVYPLAQVRRLCRDLLQSLPEPNKDGWIFVDGVRYAETLTIARHLGVATTTLRNRLTKTQISSVKGRGRQQRVANFYSVEAVRKACADLMRTVPKVNDEGFIFVNGKKYGSCSSFLPRELGISEVAIRAAIKRADVPAVEGRLKNGNVARFYSLSEVRSACKHLLNHDTPLVNDKGFFRRNGVVYGHGLALSERLGLVDATILARARKAGLEPQEGKLKGGQVVLGYALAEIRKVCRDLLDPDLPTVNEHGFVRHNGREFGTVEYLCSIVDLTKTTVRRRIEASAIPYERAKSKRGKIVRVFAVSEVRRTCAGARRRKSQDKRAAPSRNTR